MGFSGFTYALDNHEIVPLEARTTFEATIQDISSSEKTVYKHFRAYDPKSPDLEKDLGVVLDSLTMEKTELGLYLSSDKGHDGEGRGRSTSAGKFPVSGI